MKIIDSCVWISYFLQNDSEHKNAQNIIEQLENDRIAVTEYIIIEVSTILLQKSGQKSASTFIELVKSTNDLHIIYSSAQLFHTFIDFFTHNNYKKLSFIDQSLLYLSKEFEIITFDKELLKAIDILGNS